MNSNPHKPLKVSPLKKGKEERLRGRRERLKIDLRAVSQSTGPIVFNYDSILVSPCRNTTKITS